MCSRASVCGRINTEKKLSTMYTEQCSATTARKERRERERKEIEAGLHAGGKVEGSMWEWREQVHLVAHKHE